MRKSAARGKTTSAVEVLNVSIFGLWLLADGREYFADFVQFPWFRNATIDQLCSVEMPHSGHLYWPQLDVDLTLASLSHPENFPLVSKKYKRK